MTTLFISDLHLTPEEGHVVEGLHGFLRRDAIGAERLYVLGDLFEAWIGDDRPCPMADGISTALEALHANGTDIYFMAGNRDFLLGPEYAARCGFRILADPAVVLIDGTPAVLSHGDRYCIDDTEYQAFRQQVRDPAWMRAFLDKPLEEREAFAAAARAESTRQTADKTDAIMDVNSDAIGEEMQRLGVDLLIHGHTHRPAEHREAAEHCRRFVLGDWRENSAIILEASEGEFRLRELRY